MRNSLLLLSLILVVILALALYFNWKADKQDDLDYQQMRQAYEDSLRTHHNVQARLLVSLKVAEEARTNTERKDSIAAMKYRSEAARLKIQLRNARTAHVDSLVNYDSELRFFIRQYDSVNIHQQLRISSLEAEKRAQDILCDNVLNIKDSLYDSKSNEALFLAGEVDKRDGEIKKLKKKLRKWKWLAGLFGGANAIPRGN